MNGTLHMFMCRRLLGFQPFKNPFPSRFCSNIKDGSVSSEKDRKDTESSSDSTQKNDSIDGLRESLKEEMAKSKIEDTNTAAVDSINDQGDISPTKQNKRDSNIISEIKKIDKISMSQMSRPEDTVNLTDTSNISVISTSDLGEKNQSEGFLRAYEKQEEIIKAKESKHKTPEDMRTFANMLRNSAFVDMGDPKGKLVVGKIFHIMENDLYIDFGWKFHTVCERPKKNSEKYVIGAKVLLKIQDLELTAKFLGDKEYTSLLEADCVLLDLATFEMFQALKPYDLNVIHEEGTKYNQRRTVTHAYGHEFRCFQNW